MTLLSTRQPSQPHNQPPSQLPTPEQLLAVQRDFVHAMHLYTTRRVYGRIHALVATINMAMPLWLVWAAWPVAAAWPLWLQLGAAIGICVCTYAAADFVNGWVHLHMDHQSQYRSMWGPWIAQFHLHHATPRYRSQAAWRVYVGESGHKIWLALLQLGAGGALLHGLHTTQTTQTAHTSGAVAALALSAFAVWSCAAEVSHYWAHNGQGPLVQRLQSWRLLLPRAHHMRHHQQDNTHYAFLNGMSDKLLNAIARRCYSGYKQHSDTHYLLYMSQKL